MALQGSATSMMQPARRYQATGAMRTKRYGSIKKQYAREPVKGPGYKHQVNQLFKNKKSNIMKAVKYLAIVSAFLVLNACDNNRGQNGFDTHDKNDNDYEAPATPPPSQDNTMPPPSPSSTSDTTLTDTGARRMNP